MARKLAYRVLEKIDAGAFSHIALSTELDRSSLSAADKGLASRIVYGTLTWQRSLDRLIEAHSNRQLTSLHDEVVIILRLAAYQLVFLDRVPGYAIVNQAVAQARKVAPTATGFVNAVLRSMTKAELTIEDAANPADRNKKPVRWLGNRYSLPNWLANRLLQSEGGVDRVVAYMEALNAPPPIWIWSRVAVEGTAPHPVSHAFRASALDASVKAAIDAGDAFVQDLGAQLVCTFCGDVEGLEVLDACAGLGGKSLNLALSGAEKIVAVEPRENKTNLHEANAARMRVSDQIEAFDGTIEAFVEAHPDRHFPLVLVDAPCTALGVIRRHPEMRWTRFEMDIEERAEIQAEILDASARAVAPGGILVYAVCTFTREETTAQVVSFLEAHPEFELAEPPAGFEWEGFTTEDGFLSLSPVQHDSDGFFAARLRRKKEN